MGVKRIGVLNFWLIPSFITVLVLFIRRPDQFLRPYIWVEDGVNILPRYIERGWASVFEPVNGYYITSSKLISLAAFNLSFLHTPELQALLVILFTCGVILAVARTPTHLPHPLLCAIAVLLVPTDPETFAVSEYSFWWAGLLLVVALLWDSDRDKQWLRAILIVIGGLSSPLMAPIAGLLGLRAAVDRRRSDFLILIAAIPCAAVQLLNIQGQGMIHKIGINPVGLVGAADHYVGFFLIGGYVIDPVRSAGFGVLVTLLLAFAAWRVRHRLDRYFLSLVVMFVGVCLLNSARHPTFYPHPFVAGPRYYFYSFILLSWIGIWIAAVSSVRVRTLFVLVYAFALVSAWFGPGVDRGMARRHDFIDWRAHILACGNSEKHQIPIHYVGFANDVWTITLTGEQCRRLVKDSVF
jgi:hypothetical protein